MQRKLNDEFIREYSEEFSEKASAPFFESNETISGKQILTFTPSAQVNFFVLKSLFRNWQDEMKALESPFFNYKDQEVRKAMVQFMNVLSQHIEVKKDAFVRMLEESVVDTLMLASDPAGFLVMEFEALDVPQVSTKTTGPLLRYIKIHKEDLRDFFENNDGVSLDDFLENTEELEDTIDAEGVVAEQLSLMSQVLSITEDELFGHDELDRDEFDDLVDKVAEEPDSTDTKKSQPIDMVGKESLTSEIESENPDTDVEEEIKEDDELVIEKESSEPFAQEEAYDDDQEEGFEEEVQTSGHGEEDDLEQEEAEDRSEIASPDAEDSTGEKSESEETEEEISEPKESKQEPATINDTFNEASDTLADKLQNQKIQSIMEAISVNHKYMFTKELFDGDREAFVTAIGQIESCESFDEAVELLVQNFAKERSWDMNSDEVKELLKVVFRKFR